MNNLPIRIAISGASGRMGNKLIHAVIKSQELILSVVLCRKGSHLSGIDVGELIQFNKLGIIINDDLDKIQNDFDVFIDFTTPLASMIYLDFCLNKRKKMVLGTTGFNTEQKQKILTASQDIAIVHATNFSVGINVMLELLKQTTKTIGKESDIEIIDIHHRYKVDAPSGTALTIGQVIADVLKLNLTECSTYSRQGYIGKRKNHSIGFSTIRAGDIAGEHKVIFANNGERLEITHKVSNQYPFVKGAINAAIWIFHRKNGLFNFTDVLTSNK